ncbi:hypothetical protein JCM1393_10090 [Clostridium carnis]
MNRLDFIFTNFVLWILKFIMPIIIGGAIVFQFISGGKINLGSIIQGVFYALSIGTFYILIKNKGISRRKIFLFLMGIGFVSRVLWLLNANTVPVSDFRTMYNAAEEILKGNFYAFQGTSYIARFPHLTIMVLYFSLMIKIFKAPIIVIKIINLLFGIISIYLIYKICKEIFKDEDYALIGGFMASIFPAMIIYTGVFASENIAIAFYLLSIYLFIKYINSKKGLGTLILSGLLLSLGNLFRMVGFIVLLAFIIYIVVYCKNKITYKIKIIATLLISFFIILISVSFTLKEIGVTEFHLWRGAEPAITNILKGTNIESMGAWTQQKIQLFQKYVNMIMKRWKKCLKR